MYFNDFLDFVLVQLMDSIEFLFVILIFRIELDNHLDCENQKGLAFTLVS